MKTLIIYVDGMNFTSINNENTPFLHDFGLKYSLLRLKTLLAYTGIENTFISGKLPNETGIWVEFIYRKNLLGKLLKLKPLPNNYLSYVYALGKYIIGDTFLSKLHYIPRKFFDKFSSSVNYGLWKNDFFQKNTFVYYSWPFFVKNNKINLDFIKRNDEYKVKKFIKNFNEDADVYFIHIVDLDKTSHEYGLGHEKTLKEIKKQDEYCSLIANEFISKFNDGVVVLWSDHGFINVKEYIDINSIAKNFKNADYFLDSTLARFWFKDNNTRNEVANELKKLKNGHILSIGEKNMYNIPQSTEQGEVIFAADPGYLILPNFYQGKKPCNGMHGYMPDKADLDGFFIINRKTNKKTLNMNECLGVIYGNL
ncbi:alkaline phosphatase family protein [Candidatus Woesearchaeota archaeon]|nr:alkaline phosphatase family protein [Candidatus Woesearchaeota archaeon]